MYNIVWVPKNSEIVLEGNLRQKAEEALRTVAAINGWEIHELDMHGDHVRIIMQIPYTISVNAAIQFLKSRSSKMVREELHEVKRFLCGTSFWAEGYFVEICGQLNKELMREYIRNELINLLTEI